MRRYGDMPVAAPRDRRGDGARTPRPVWPFVGREAEIRAAVTRLGRRGEPGVLLVGEAGVGKSRMLDAIVLGCRDEGMHVAVTTGAEAPGGLPFATMAPLLPEQVHRDTANVFAAAAGALREAAGDRPCVVAVDDVQHLDEMSVALVQHLAVTVGARVLATARTGSTSAPAVAALLRRPFVQASAVEPLDRPTVGTLLGTALDGPVDGLTVDGLWRVTRGNPLFLRHLVDACRVAGTLRQVNEVWRWKGRMPAQHGLRDLVADLIGGLTGEQARALSYVAHAEPVPLDVIETLVGTTVLVELEQRSLISVERVHRDLVIRTGHPLYGETVRTRSDEEERRDVHRALARAVSAGRPSADWALLRTVTWRLAAGDPVPGEQVVGAASDALSRCDAPLAERLARHAGTEAGADVLARALVAQDKAAEAERLLAGRMAAPVTSADEFARVAALRALNLFWNLRRPADAEEILRRTRAQGPLDGEASAELAVAELALIAFGDGTAGLVSDLAPDDPARSSAGVRDGVVASVRDLLQAYLNICLGRPARTAAAYEAGLLGAPRAWGSMRAATAACQVQALALAGRLDEAFAVARSGYRVAVEREASAEAALLAFGLGICEVWAGRPGRALPHFREARALLGEQVPFPIQVYVLAEFAACLAATGRFDESRRTLEEVTRRLPAASNLHAHLGMARIRADAHARGADAHAPGEDAHACEEPDGSAGGTGGDEARRALLGDLGDLGDLAELAAALGEHYRSQGWFTKAVEAFYHSVRLRPARAVADALSEAVAHCDGELFALFDRHGRAAASGDVDGLVAVAEALAERGYNGLAVEAVSTATDLAAERGEDRLVARLRIQGRELARSCEGYAPPWAVRAEPQAVLSERERETCELAAGGMTNDDIAERLGLSRRTVANHLHHAYGKLGVRGREDLAEALGLPRPVLPVGLSWLSPDPRA